MPAAFDFAVTSGLRADVVERSAQDGSSATHAYEDFKRHHLDTERLCHNEGIKFIPMIAEADGGGWGPQAHKVIHEIAKLRATLSGDLEDKEAQHFLQSLNLILHRENARAILRRHPHPTCDADRTILAAASIAVADVTIAT